jgi:hypothetical protein
VEKSLLVLANLLNHRNLDAKVLPNGSEMCETDHIVSLLEIARVVVSVLTTSVKAELLAEQPRSMS